MHRLLRSLRLSVQGALGLLWLGPLGAATPQQATALVEVLPSQAFDHGAPEHPDLGWAGSPEPGGSFELTLRDVSALGVLAWSGSPAPTPVAALGGLLHVDAPFQSQVVFPDGGGLANGLLAANPVPASLIGLDAVAQAASLDFTYPGLWRLTDALRVRFGYVAPVDLKFPTTALNTLMATTLSATPEFQSVVGDLDGDGLDEVYVSGGIFAGVLKRDPQGRLDQTLLQDLSLLLPRFFGAPGDFDGDGRDEVPFSSWFGAFVANSSTRVYGLDSVTGDFVPLYASPIDIGGSSTAAGDATGDGLDDLLIMNVVASTLELQSGSPQGLSAVVFSTPLVVGSSPLSRNGVRAADLNADGLTDAVLALNGQVQEWLSNGGGTGSVQPLGAFTDVFALELMQLDSDGIVDVVVGTSQGGTSEVWVRRSATPTAGFTLVHTEPVSLDRLVARPMGAGIPDRLALIETLPGPETLELEFDASGSVVQTLRTPRGSGLVEITAAQLDSGGSHELVLVDLDQQHLIAATEGAPAPEPFFNETLNVHWADFNGDGVQDYVRVQNSGVEVSFVDGLSGVATVSAVGGGVPEVTRSTVGDFNSDGHLDVILGATWFNPWIGARLLIGLGAGDGTFAAPDYLSGGWSLPFNGDIQWSFLECEDFDGDGQHEVAYGWLRESGGTAGLDVLQYEELFGLGSITAGPFTEVLYDQPLDSLPTEYSSGDLNGDGVRDLVWNRGAGELRLGTPQGWVTIALSGEDMLGPNGMVDSDRDGRSELYFLRGFDLLRLDVEASPIGLVETNLGSLGAYNAFHFGDINADGIPDILTIQGEYLRVAPLGYQDEASQVTPKWVYTGIPGHRLIVGPPGQSPPSVWVIGEPGSGDAVKLELL